MLASVAAVATKNVSPLSQGGCLKGIGCVACPADSYPAWGGAQKCFGTAGWDFYGSGCALGDGIEVCKPCSARGCAPGACDTKGMCRRCAPGWVPAPANKYDAPGGCLKIESLRCFGTFSAAKPGCMACPNSTFAPSPTTPDSPFYPYWTCYKDGDE